MNTKLIGSFILGMTLTTCPLSAQETASRPTLTLEQYTAGNPAYLQPRNISALQWLGNDYIYVDGKRLVIGRPGSKVSERTLLSLEDLQSLVGEQETGFRGKSFPSFRVIGARKDLLKLSSSTGHYIVDPRAKKLLASYPRAEEIKAELISPDLSYRAVVRGHQLEIESLTADNPHHITLTQDGSAEIVYGQSVHQNEFGIDGGLFWSPNGRRLAYYRMDQSMVHPYPILHVNDRKPYAEQQYYPMAGMPIHHVSIGVYDLDTKQTIYLQTSTPGETYLTNVCWSPDGGEIFVAEVNRAQNRSELKAFDPTTGKALRTLFVEEDDRYIEPRYPARFVPGKNNLFIWQSRRDGWDHLYLYNTEGRLIRQLTRGEWEVVSVLDFSPDGKQLYYLSTEESPLGRNLYSLSIATGKKRPLTPEAGWHSPRLSADGKHFIDHYESTEVARQIKLYTTQGKQLRTMLTARHPELDYARPIIELGTIKAADQETDLYYRLIKPTNFDPNKRYPTIIYVYNGPHAQLVQNRYRAAARGWELHMATLGYVIFTVDGRGSAYRGAKFEQVIHRCIGTHEMADQMRGVDFLRSLPYVDGQRIGVYGWSYGGFMTTNLMLTHPETFKVGVAGGGVMDWSRYEAMYGERYMDTPQENPEGYRANNLLHRAADLRGRLLMIHGTIDPVVIWQHTLLFVKAAVKAGSLPDYMLYPEHPHNVIGPDRVHLNKVITRYFQDHL